MTLEKVEIGERPAMIRLNTLKLYRSLGKHGSWLLSRLLLLDANPDVGLFESQAI